MATALTKLGQEILDGAAAGTAIDQNGHLRAALTLARDKLRFYREAHGGEYVGGMEYTALMRQIDDCLK